MSCNLKKRADKPYQYQSDQRFFCEYTYVKHISDHLRRSQKQTNFKSHSLTKNFFGLNILAIYFPLKLIFCTARKSFFDLNFLSLSSESYSCFHKKNCWSFYHKCAVISSYNLLIGSFEFNKNPNEKSQCTTSKRDGQTTLTFKISKTYQ